MGSKIEQRDIPNLNKQFLTVKKIADEPKLTRGGLWDKAVSGIDPKVWEKNVNGE